MSFTLTEVERAAIKTAAVQLLETGSRSKTNAGFVRGYATRRLCLGDNAGGNMVIAGPRREDGEHPLWYASDKDGESVLVEPGTIKKALADELAVALMGPREAE